MLSNGPTGSSEGRLPHPPTPDPTLTRPATPSRRIAEFDAVIEEAEKKARALREDSLKLEVTRRRPVAAFWN